MDEGKRIEFEERRKKAAKEVILIRIDEMTFNVVDKEGNFKYTTIVNPGEEDCTCPNFVNNNTEKQFAARGEFFLCKHIFAGQYVNDLEKRSREATKTHIQEISQNATN